MAEEGSVCELEGLEKQLQTLLSRYSSDELRADSEPFCSDFCKLVEEYASRWQVPLPQLRIIEIALIYFTQASTSFTSNCDHVLHTLSSLALSVFELLLFFDQKDFHQEPLKHFTATFQECNLALARHQNVHLLQVAHLVQGGGPWASLVLQAILSDSILPQNEVDGCISSELPVFFELRVRYLLSSEQISEAMALAKCCARHPTTGQHLFFLQVYLTWLHKTSQHDRLHEKVNDLNGKEAVHIICSLECDEEDDLLLALTRAFLSQQLHRGDMYYLCDLIFIWSKLHSRLNTSNQTLLEESRQLMLSATNVNSIFPFIRAILQELGEDGIQFCVELCASALESCLPCDVVSKSLIYKTIAGLLPNDLEICRACALLVFFLERTFEAYKMVYLLYMHPDQEYHADYSPIGNNVRFETLQVLKKDLYFDPEFWNLIALRTNCLKLMNEKVVSAALEEIMEDKWIPNYCAKESAFRSSTLACRQGSKGAIQPAAKKRHLKEDAHTASKRLKVGPGQTQLNAVKKKTTKGSQTLNKTSSKPLRRSFWQLDRIQDNVAIAYGEHRRITRLSEKNPPKRRIRKPKWLLEDSGTPEENKVLPKIKKHGLKHQKHHRSSIVKRAESGQINNIVKYKPSVNCHLKASENNDKQQRLSESSLDCLKPATPPQVILELSLPDNELMGTFNEDSCNRQRGLPQVLLYKPTMKLPATPQNVKTVHGKEVVLRARDEAMFVLQLHCYARQQKGKGKGLNIQGSVSTITRSSVQGSPPKEPPRELCEKPATEMRGGVASQTLVAADVAKSQDLENVLQVQAAKPVLRKTSSAREPSEKFAVKLRTTTASQTSAAAQVTETPMLDKSLQAQTTASVEEPCEEPAVEMKVTIASQTQTVAKVTQSPNLDKVPAVDDISKVTASPEVSQTITANDNQVEVTDEIPLVSNMANMSNIGPSHLVPSESQDTALRDGLRELKSSLDSSSAKADVTEGLPKDLIRHVPCGNDRSFGESVVTLTNTLETQATSTAIDQDSLNDISALTLVTEMVTELPPKTLAQDLENDKRQAPSNSSSKESKAGSKPKVPHKTSSITSWSVPEHETSTAVDVQEKKGRTQDIAPEIPENDEPMETPPESEESKLEYCCTFCNKVFKGSRVVAHAMFHYRKDECMFCGTVFKDDLLAMMHLSDHIEKLKKSKDLAGNKAQQNWVSETKDISTPKTSKAKATNVSSVRRSSMRLKKSVCSKSLSLPDSSPSESRKLRSNEKPVDGEFLQEKKQNPLKQLNGETPVHKVNGHIGKRQALVKAKKNLEAKQPLTQQKMPLEQRSNGYKNLGLPENHDMEVDSSTSSIQVEKDFGCSGEMKERESLQVLKTATKQNGNVGEKNGEPQENVCCPVDGCVWFTKSRVALLYHALEDHYGEVKPLEMAFRVGNSRCSICMRVLWSFEHFLHHVERHRLSPRHPCPHQGCTARFKTGMEMRRHARRHSPLQAVCCLPGCSQLFICLWALNLHEREHYASKSDKPDKNTNMQTGDKQNNTQTVKKQQDCKSNDATAVNKAESVKIAHKLRRQATHKTSSTKHKDPISTVSTSLLKHELKERNETKDSNILKTLSNKDASAQPTVLNLRLRQTLRKVTNATMAASKTHKVISSSLLRHNNKLRYKFKKNQVKVNAKDSKRRGRPPKSDKAVRDENTATGQKNETARTALQKDQKSPAELSSNLKTAETLNKLIEGKKAPVVRTTETSPDKSMKSKKLMKKLRKLKKRSSSQTALDSTKSNKHKATKDKGNRMKIKKKRPLKESTEAVIKTSEDTGKVQVENTDSIGSNPENPVPAVTADSLNETTAPPTASRETTQKLTTEEKSKKSHITKKGKKERNSQDSCSDKANKKFKDVNKKGDKSTVKERQPCKDRRNTAVVKKPKAKSEVQQQDEATATLVNTLDEMGKEKLETSGPTLDHTDPCIAASHPAVTADHTQKVTEKKSKKPGAIKNTDPSKAVQKRKNSHKESESKIVKKKCQDQSPTEESTTFGGTVQSTASSPGYSLVMNGQAVKEDLKSTVCTGILAKYSKRPYMRLPPTAYLDEKYITMPKRRKEISFFPLSQKSPPPEKTGITTALQRQRCANCFATFNSAEELQSHLQLQKCSNLFGFDSDDEDQVSGKS
ncbi:uncharacterized protein LOC113163725 [Anabas testudineus]|uniref:C2H2-type domain-containing protein n=1 Tax=Anabas testudineus TaxID=64144 RepID=A0AAQ6IP24_ANATE|nr:uncharacterized protein LOC113163725 [Anabas testudineus]